MSEEKKMTKEEADIIEKDGYPASDEELENVAGGFNAMAVVKCRTCGKYVNMTSVICNYCHNKLG